MIKIENLTFGYEKNILDNASATIKDNKITMIIGQNGAGKTTLGTILAGLNSNFKGKIYVENFALHEKYRLKDLRHQIGMVFQDPNNQIVFNKVYDDIKFTLDNMETAKEDIPALVNEALEYVGMQDFINSNAYNLSGGEKAKIALASMLVLKPKYLILDEATAFLDTKAKEDIYVLMQKLKKEHLGIIFITNNMEELIYADDLIILDNHKLYTYSSEEVFNNLSILTNHGLTIPFNLQVKKFLIKKGHATKTIKEMIKELEKL